MKLLSKVIELVSMDVFNALQLKTSMNAPFNKLGLLLVTAKAMDVKHEK